MTASQEVAMDEYSVQSLRLALGIATFHPDVSLSSWGLHDRPNSEALECPRATAAPPWAQLDTTLAYLSLCNGHIGKLSETDGPWIPGWLCAFLSVGTVTRSCVLLPPPLGEAVTCLQMS